MAGFIWDRKSGEQIAWIENDHSVCSVTTKRKFATERNGELLSLDGHSLNLHLENLHDGGANLVSAEKDADALVRFKKLANES